MADMTAQTITLEDGDKAALQYLGAAVVLQWRNLPESAQQSILQQAESTGGLALVPELHEQIKALLKRSREDAAA